MSIMARSIEFYIGAGARIFLIATTGGLDVKTGHMFMLAAHIRLSITPWIGIKHPAKKLDVALLNVKD